MTLYEFGSNYIKEISKCSFADHAIREREDLQRLLRDNIQVICPGTMVISEEFSHWDEGCRRIDLLVLDKNANLIVIELKRTEDGGHMELQAIRYAAMVSTMTFEQTVNAHETYLQRRNIEEDAQERILGFLEWSEPQEDKFAQDVKILLVSAEFSKEITTSVMWLNNRDLDITCIRLRPYQLDGKILLDVQQVIPLPEASEYMIRVREKEKSERSAESNQWDEDSFMKALENNKGSEVVKIARDILEWAKQKTDRIFWGKGKQTGSFVPAVGSKDAFFISIWTNGLVENQFQWLAYRDAFKEECDRKQLLCKLNQIPGVDFSEEVLTRRPSFELEKLADKEAMFKFKETYEWVIDQLRDRQV